MSNDFVDHFIRAANEQRAVATALRVKTRTRHLRASRVPCQHPSSPKGGGLFTRRCMMQSPKSAFLALATRTSRSRLVLGGNSFLSRIGLGQLGIARAEVVILQRQRTNPFACDGENGIAHRWGNPSKSFFADPNNRFVRRTYKMDSYFRHFGRSQQRIVVKIALHDASFLEGDFLAEYRRKPHHHLHLEDRKSVV